MSTTAKLIDGRKVAVYIRWSTDDQGEGTTLDVQLNGCQHYVLSQGWQLNEDLIFIDEGYSGGNMERPAISRLRKLVKAGKVDCVVVFKVDRLSRSVVDTVNLVLEEWDGRTYLKSAREPIDTTTAMGKQFFYMLVSYAEWERSVIRERTVAGRRRRAEDGYKPSAVAPYGYKHSPTRRGALEVIAAEAEIVREIFRLCNTGLGAKTIASALNKRGTPYRDNKLWNDRTILYMLQNQIYVGDMVYGRRARNPRHGKEPGETVMVSAEPLVVHNSEFIPPIVSRTEFSLARDFRCQRRTGQGKPSGRANSSSYLLSGIARCRCGFGLYVKQHGGPKRKHEVFSYSCIGKRMKGPQQCDCAPVPMADLDAELERRVRERFSSSVAQESFMERIVAGHRQERRLREAERLEVDRLLADLEVQEKKIRRDYRMDKINAEEYRDLKREIAQETEDLRARLQTLEAAIAACIEKERGDLLVREQLDRLDQWNSLEVTERKSLLRFFVDRLVVYRRPGDRVIEIDVRWIATGE